MKIDKWLTWYHKWSCKNSICKKLEFHYRSRKSWIFFEKRIRSLKSIQLFYFTHQGQEILFCSFIMLFNISYYTSLSSLLSIDFLVTDNKPDKLWNVPDVTLLRMDQAVERRRWKDGSIFCVLDIDKVKCQNMLRAC